MRVTEFRNTAKYMLVALFSLILISSFAENRIQTVQTYVPPGGWPPGQPYFTLHAVVTNNPYAGRFGGYHAIWGAIQNSCAQIGINLEIHFYDDYIWYDRVWEDGWDKSYTAGGWDMTTLEWWLQPHAPDPWFTSLVAGWADPWPLPEGRNIFDWNNTKADQLLHLGMHAFDANQRKAYLDLWQEEFMRDPPWANIYYPKVYDVMGRYVTGYDPSGCRFSELSHLNLNNTMLAAASPNRDNRTLVYGVTEPLWNMNPLFTQTRTDQAFGALCWDTLYKWSVDPFPMDAVVEPDWSVEAAIKPDLAADYPTILDGGTRVRVPLRQGMVWSDGVKINASDVKWTFDTMMNPQSKATGSGDFSYVIESVEIVDAYTVDFILHYPCPDILSILANDWGSCIVPRHFLKDIPVENLKSHASNWDFTNSSNWLPVTGPFAPVEVWTGENITFVKNPDYFGYNETIVGSPAWGPYNIDTFIIEWMPSATAMLTAITTNAVDFGEYPVGSVATFQALNDTDTYPYLRVLQYKRPASNPVWFNLNNPYLSNRYVRQAICHVIPYGTIFNDILPEWGIETAYPGKTPILPQHYYTDENNVTVHLFNDALLPYEYNIAKAQQYLDLYRYSLVGTDYTLGPVGDADFSGKVDTDDFLAWRDEFGKTTDQITFEPGRPIDPDWDNNGFVEMRDFYRWMENYGDTYP